MFELFLQPESYISLLSLTFLEIVLGIDNLIFISILAGKLPQENRQKARVLGLSLGLFGRLALLCSVSWLIRLTDPLFTIPFFQVPISIKDLVLLAGGIFLIAKSVHEIHEKIEVEGLNPENMSMPATISFRSIILQIIMIDIVFSLDSIITAVGLVSQLAIMVVAVLIACGIMIWASQGIGDFIDRHPSIKILALSFLLMIGTLLVAEAFHVHVPKGYVYFSLLFALIVEGINIKTNSRKNA